VNAVRYMADARALNIRGEPDPGWPKIASDLCKSIIVAPPGGGLMH
jgi:hypothetical protein